MIVAKRCECGSTLFRLGPDGQVICGTCERLGRLSTFSADEWESLYCLIDAEILQLCAIRASMREPDERVGVVQRLAIARGLHAKVATFALLTERTRAGGRPKKAVRGSAAPQPERAAAVESALPHEPHHADAGAGTSP